MIIIGERLKKLRLGNCLRQDQVARLVRVERSAVSLWENGLRQPSYQTLVRLADVYGVTTDFLLGRDTNKLLDLSGLSAIEETMITQLVATMAAKNKKLEEIEQ